MAANITIQCPTCGKQGEAPAEYEGRTANCNECGTKFSAVAMNKNASSNSEAAVARGTGADGVPLEWKVGDTILNLYAVNHVFTSGGMGLVYRVHHQSWNVDLAVKSPRPQFFQTEAHKQNFVAEAQTWVNLGMHPHIASCFYVRTLGGIPRVFAEYIEGGSLADWIKSRKLYEGGHQAALERILDIAIQFAWGLHYAHEQGLVHQDVKPANVLMTADGTAKVSDFGLAKARASTGETQTMNRGGTTMVTSGGLTPAYASPEQVGRTKLTRRTDIWSWAVSVLEMFTGEPTWMSGSAAGEALEAYLEEAESSEILPAMPEELAALLRRCFENNPAARPVTMQVVADDLRGVYQSVVGKEYSRAAPQPLKSMADTLNNKAVSLIDLGQRDEAEKALEEALKVQSGHQQASYNLAALHWQSGRATDEDVLQSADEEHKAAFKQLQKDFVAGRATINRDLNIGPSCVLTLKDISTPACLSPYGLHLLSSEYLFDEEDSSLKKVWLVLSDLIGEQTRKFSCEHTGSIIRSLCFDITGRLALSSSYDGSIRLWNVESGKCLRVLAGNSLDMDHVVLSPNARFVFSYGNIRGMSLWSLKDGKCLRSWEGVEDECISFFGQGGGRGGQIENVKVKFVAFSPNSKLALIVGDVEHDLLTKTSTNVRLLDISTGKYIRKLTLGGEPSCIAFSPNGQYLAVGGDTLSLWETKSFRQILSFDGHRGKIDSVSFVADGKTLLSGSGDGTLRLWDVESSKSLRVLEAQSSYIPSVSLSADGAWAATTTFELTRIWSLQPVCPTITFALVKPQNTLELLQREQMVESALTEARIAEAQGQFAVAAIAVRQAQEVPGYEKAPILVETMNRLGCHGTRVGLHDAWLSQNLQGHCSTILSVAFSPNGKFILSGGNDDTVRLWEVETGKCKWASEVLTGDEVTTGEITDVSFSPDGSQAASVSYGNAMRLWDVQTGQCIRTFEFRDNQEDWWLCLSVCFSPDGKYILTGGSNHDVVEDDIRLRLWDIKSGECIRCFKGNAKDVTSATFSLDGQLILSSNDDHTFHLWDVATGECIHVWDDFTEGVYMVCFSPDGKYILSLSETVQMWDAKTFKIVRQFEDLNASIAVFSPDGRFILANESDTYSPDSVEIIDVRSGKKIYTMRNETKFNENSSLCLSRDGNFVAYGIGNYSICVWRLDWDYKFPDVV